MVIRRLLTSILARFPLRPAKKAECGSATFLASSEVLDLGTASDFAKSIKEHIPPYLTLEQKEALASALERVPEAKEYYLSGRYVNEMLQGDCWRNLKIFKFDTGDKRDVPGVILSNSCDISPDNKRAIGPNIVFSPVIKLSKYEQLLRNSGIDPVQIRAKVEAIKNQTVTTIFYLPDAIGGLADEYIVVLDDVHTMPASALRIGTENTKGFTLSNLGFYMFIFKLSINFCRLRENVVRAA